MGFTQIADPTTGWFRISRTCCGNRGCAGVATLDRTGGEDSFDLATTGAAFPWKVKSGRSTWGKTRISANKQSSKIRKVQRHPFMKSHLCETNLSHPARPVNKEFLVGISRCSSVTTGRLSQIMPVGTEPSPPDVVRFVSILSKARGVRASLPVTLPSDGEWLVRVISVGGPVRVWSVPSSHEVNRLSWPDRQAVRCASDDTELEHNRCDRSTLAGRWE